MKYLLALVALLAVAACDHMDTATPDERAVLTNPESTPEQIATVEATIEERAAKAINDAAGPWIPAPFQAPVAATVATLTALAFKRYRRVLTKPLKQAKSDPGGAFASALKAPLQLVGLLDSDRTAKDYIQEAEDAAWREKDYELVQAIRALIASREVQP